MLVTHTQDVLAELHGLLSTMQDVETGQRGYVITGDEQYSNRISAPSRSSMGG